MSCRDWLPPTYRFGSDDPKVDLDLEMRCVFVFERLWAIALLNCQDGLSTTFEWPGVFIVQVIEPWSPTGMDF